MRAAVAVDEGLDPGRAMEQAGDAALANLGGPAALAIAFVSTAHGCSAALRQASVPGLAGAGVCVAVHVEGVISDAGERAAMPAVAVLALGGAGVRFDLHSFDHARGREDELGDELVATFADLGCDDLVLVVADAHELDPRSLAAGLSRCAPACVLGVGVEGPAGGPAAHAIDGEVSEGGALAIRLRAPSALRCALAPATSLCGTRTVTSTRGNWIVELDGASALEEFRDAAGALWDDERRAMRSVLVALPELPGAEPEPALVRGVVGIDPEQGAIALAEPVEVGQRLAFARRDALAAREALAAAGESLAPLSEGGGIGLASSCRARGEALFGHAGIESGYLARAFRPAPWLGLIGSYQIAGTRRATSSLLTHTAALVRLV
ncbi:MAG: FIST C-terminal domain-containing protein [Myxococcota bacterium]|nr:FIST C-terminal domain-containing protein [Myxococcota bacterium]